MAKRTGKNVIQPTVADIAEQRDLERKVLELALQRMNGAQIARELGIHRATVGRILQRVFDRQENLDAPKLRKQQNANIQAVLRVWLPRCLGGDEKAAFVVLRFLEREARLNGLDAPAAMVAQIAADVPADPEQREAIVRDLQARLAERLATS